MMPSAILVMAFTVPDWIIGAAFSEVAMPNALLCSALGTHRKSWYITTQQNVRRRFRMVHHDARYRDVIVWWVATRH